MVRFVTRQSPFRKTNIVTAFLALMTAGISVAIVLWPSTPPDPIDDTFLTETPLSKALDDDLTHAYLGTLHRVEPKISRDLHNTAETYIADGATQEDLAALVATTYTIDLSIGFEDLLQADMKYLEKMMRMGQSRLSSLSFHESKYCRLATLEALDQQSPEDSWTEMRQMFPYKSKAYEWMLRFSVLKLLAIEDGRNNPKSYKRMTTHDMVEIKAMAERLTRSRALSQFSTLQSASPAAQQRALKTMDLCEVGTEVLAAVNALPSDMKGRILTEMKRLRKKGAIKKMGRDLFGDSCGVCSAF